MALSRAARRLVVQNLVIAAVFITGLAISDLAGHLPLGVAGHESSTVIVGQRPAPTSRRRLATRLHAGGAAGRRTRNTTAAVQAVETARCTVSVCRGCCCGTEKIPGLDHSAQLDRLRSTVCTGGQVRATDCLDDCEHANVIVVQPSAAGRAAGGRHGLARPGPRPRRRRRPRLWRGCPRCR